MMCSVKRFLEFSMMALTIAVFWGCATPPSKPNDIYYPKLPAGIQTVEEARKDLAAALNTRKMGAFYKGIPCPHPFPTAEAQAEFSRRYPAVTEVSLLQDGTCFIYFNGVRVLPDRIDTPILPFYFKDLKSAKLCIQSGAITLSDEIGLFWVNEPRVADDLYFIQQNLDQFREEEARRFSLFEAQAAQYRALKDKPPVSEEQRRYIVQANAMLQRKDYIKAIDFFKKAIEVNPTAYPAAYYNMALLYAEHRMFGLAISRMKQYLLLETDAKEARKAQDKIYEWEALSQK